MVLYIFPSELFIVFPDIFVRFLGRGGITSKPSGRKNPEIFSLAHVIDYSDFLRENGIQKCRNTVTGLQVGPEYRHPGIVPVDI